MKPSLYYNICNYAINANVVLILHMYYFCCKVALKQYPVFVRRKTSISQRKQSLHCNLGNLEMLSRLNFCSLVCHFHSMKLHFHPRNKRGETWHLCLAEELLTTHSETPAGCPRSKIGSCVQNGAGWRREMALTIKPFEPFKHFPVLYWVFTNT